MPPFTMSFAQKRRMSHLIPYYFINLELLEAQDDPFSATELFALAILWRITNTYLGLPQRMIDGQGLRLLEPLRELASYLK